MHLVVRLLSVVLLYVGFRIWRSQPGVDSGKGQNRTLREMEPVERAIDGPLADGAALLRHYTLSDDDIERSEYPGAGA